MNIIVVLFTLVVTISAIRVPTAWPGEIVHTKHSKPIAQGSYHRKYVHNRPDFRIYPQNPKIRMNQNVHKRPMTVSKLPPRVHQYHSKPKKLLKKYMPEQNMWTPIAPYSISTNLGYTSPRPNVTFNLKQFPKTHYTPASNEYVTSRNSPLYNNYRDDRTYEPKESREEIVEETSPDIERPPVRESDHEHPSDIPTAPIYPGEGEWAKPGRKHKPYVSKQKYSHLPEESSEKPDGYEIFENGQKLHDDRQKHFANIRKNKYPETENDEDQNARQEEESESSNEEDSFVPSTLYAQVRRSENEEHLPSDADDAEGGRLKEVIKDSNILTVYTEEGYEDSAYDHAGHEKEAEDSQGYKEFNKEEEKEKKPEGSLENHRLENIDQNEDGSSNIYKIITQPKISKRKKYTPKNINVYNKLIKSESTKTMKLKEEPDGTQMEITGAIKTTTKPNNNETEKIVTILPKIVKFSNSTVQNLEREFNSTPAVQEEIPTSDSPIHLSRTIRKKRYTNDFPKFDVKTDFVDGIIRNDVPNLNVQVQQEKYPYYNSESVQHNSPLKYAENMDNIPVKTEGHMAFYEQANRIQCPEIDDDIDAIPKRVQEVEKSVNSGEKLEEGDQAGKSPRLGKLGQRIDCFKRKYFGENPLDSPFFKEDEVESVPPVFKVLQEKNAGFQAHHDKLKNPISNSLKKKYHSKFRHFRARQNPSVDSGNVANSMEDLNSGGIVDDVGSHQQPEDSRRENNVQFTPKVEIINVDTFKGIEQVTADSSYVNPVTTSNYPIVITPNNIYDQIKLLNLLPSPSTGTTVGTSEDNLRRGKYVEDGAKTAELQYRPNPNFQKFVPRRPHRVKNNRPKFDIETFIRDQSRRVTITPNSYKTENIPLYNEQSPLDQMNVFADVINNIKNGSNDPLRGEGSSYYNPNHVDNFQNSIIRMRVPPKKIHIKAPETVKYSNERKIYYRTTTLPTTLSPPTKQTKRGSIRYAFTTEKDINYDDYLDTDDESVYGRKENSVKTSTSPLPDEDEGIYEEDSEVSGTHTTESIQKPPVIKKIVAEIVGLVPPSKHHYRTIYQPVEELVSEPVVAESEVFNNYHVLGMKPPSTKQKVYDYNDFQKIVASKNANNHKYRSISHRRGKRSPNRKSYFEVIQRHSSNDEELASQEEDDDYVPHRPKNWHWDETLKKIVYDSPKEEDNSDINEDELEVGDIEVEDSTSRNIQQTTTRRSFTSTTPLNGPSYVDFVKLLRNKEEYVSIPDPTTSKEGMKVETTSPTTTTVKTDPTNPPAFLSFVSKLKQSDSYKMIVEKNKTKIATTTTELPEEEEEEEAEDTETALSNVQNSPGRGAVDIGQSFKIFDVNEFMPKVKTYSPRTEIDYSKYKTIQRPRARTTTEANENKEDQNINVKESNYPFMIEESQSPSSTEGEVEIFELSRPTTPTTTTTSTTTIKIQRTRRRRPTTTQKTIASSATNTRENVATLTTNKTKRFYPRRRQPHIRARTTTQRIEGESSEEDDEPEETQRVLRKRHNTVERSPKIISLESIIEMDQRENLGQQNTTSKSDTKTNKISGEVTVDDVLKNINRLKEMSVEEIVQDYSTDSGVNEEESTDGKDEYFDDENTKIALDSSGSTNRKLVISKDKQQGMLYYTSVR